MSRPAFEGVTAEEQSRNGKAESLVAFHPLGLLIGATLFYLTLRETAVSNRPMMKSNVLKKSIFETNININNFFQLTLFFPCLGIDN